MRQEASSYALSFSLLGGRTDFILPENPASTPGVGSERLKACVDVFVSASVRFWSTASAVAAGCVAGHERLDFQLAGRYLKRQPLAKGFPTWPARYPENKNPYYYLGVC